MSTAQRVQQYLETHCTVSQRGDNWRCTSPLRAHSDSPSFSITFEGDEHGAWTDHVTDESGSLYELARRLGIEPEIGPAENTHRAFDGLAEYAVAHGVTEDVLTKAGWKEDGYMGESAVAIPTANGTRYRLLGDSDQGRWRNPKGYQKCWYGLDRAVKMATAHNEPLIICNGEPSTVVAQHYGLPACAVTSGEGRIPDNLVDELRAAWDGRIVIAMDCDEKGEAAAQKIEDQLDNAVIVDLKLSKGGDLADFCKLHGDTTREAFAEIVPEHTERQASAAQYADTQLANVIIRMKNPGSIRGFKSGLPSLDRAISGFQRGRSYIFYGDTGMGKSTLMTTFIPHIAEETPLLIDSTETPPGPYLNKIACGMITRPGAPITFDMLEDGRLTPEQYVQYEKAIKRLADLPIIFIRTPPRADAIVDEVEYAIKHSGIGVYIQDSISNVNGSTPNVYEKTVEAADALMDAARLNIAVIATSQVGRNMKDRKSKMPNLHDAQGGGRIEQNADSIWSVYRHQYYVDLGEAEPIEQFGPNTTALTCLKDRWRGKQGQSVRVEMVGGARFHEQERAK